MSKFVRLNADDIVVEIISGTELPPMHPDLAARFSTFPNGTVVAEGDVWDGESFTTPTPDTFSRATTQAVILTDLLVTKGVLLRGDIPPELTSD